LPSLSVILELQKVLVAFQLQRRFPVHPLKSHQTPFTGKISFKARKNICEWLADRREVQRRLPLPLLRAD
jgi:hypothetical protein